MKTNSQSPARQFIAVLMIVLMLAAETGRASFVGMPAPCPMPVVPPCQQPFAPIVGAHSYTPRAFIRAKITEMATQLYTEIQQTRNLVTSPTQQVINFMYKMAGFVPGMQSFAAYEAFKMAQLDVAEEWAASTVFTAESLWKNYFRNSQYPDPSFYWAFHNYVATLTNTVAYVSAFQMSLAQALTPPTPLPVPFWNKLMQYQQMINQVVIARLNRIEAAKWQLVQLTYALESGIVGPSFPVAYATWYRTTVLPFFPGFTVATLPAAVVPFSIGGWVQQFGMAAGWPGSVNASGGTPMMANYGAYANGGNPNIPSTHYPIFQNGVAAGTGQAYPLQPTYNNVGMPQGIPGNTLAQMGQQFPQQLAGNGNPTYPILGADGRPQVDERGNPIMRPNTFQSGNTMGPALFDEQQARQEGLTASDLSMLRDPHTVTPRPIPSDIAGLSNGAVVPPEYQTIDRMVIKDEALPKLDESGGARLGL